MRVLVVFRGREWKDGRLHDDPLGVGRETMRELGYRTVDLLVDWLDDDDAPPLRRASPEEMQARLGGPAPDGPEPFDEILRRLAEDVLPFASRVAAPALLRLHPRQRHLAGRARRPDRERGERLRGILDGVGRAEPGRARGAPLVRRLARLPRDGRRHPRQRRLGGEHDRARLRARDARRRDDGRASSRTSPTRRTRRSRGRHASSASGRSRCACCRSDADQRLEPRTLAAAIDADVTRRPPTALRLGERRLDQHRRRRPLRALAGRLRRARRLVPRRRGLRRVRRADDARPRAARRHRPRRLDHPRSAQVALPALRVRLPARARRPHAPERVRDHAGLPERLRRRRRQR